MNRLFYTDGKRNILEGEYDKPEIKSTEIEVQSVYTGICRSDIDMYTGAFQLLPKTIQGHECVGIVTKVGNDISTVKEGDFVATRGEPGFADYYNAGEKMFVKVPELSPKYILEPVACGINIAHSLDVSTQDDILILGSGFLATIVHKALSRHYTNEITVVGNANKTYWRNHNVKLATAEQIRDKKFDYVVDLSDKPEYLGLNIYNECAKIVLAAEKHPSVTTSFAEFLWKAVEIKFPSPRNERFYDAMKLSEVLITQNVIDVDSLWSMSFDRDTEVKKGFETGLLHLPGYSRGYISWQK